MDWLAISVQGEVEKYGVYVGIAAFFGLAVLSLLYFAQARELKRLREWAGRAPERAQELEERVIAQADAARQGAPVRRLAEMPVIPPPPVPAATAAAAAPQATVEADVLEEADDDAAAAASTNGHHAGPVPPPDTTVSAPEAAEDGEQAPADEDADKAAVAAGAGDEAREASAEADADGAATTAATPAGADETEPADGGDGPPGQDPEAPTAAVGESEPAEADAPEQPDEPGPDDDPHLPFPEPESAEEIRVRAVEHGAEAAASPDVEGARPEPAQTQHGDTAEVGAVAASHDDEAPEEDASDGLPADDRDADDDDESPAVAIPRATPAQRPLTASRPGAAPLSRSQPSASPRRPGGPPPRRSGTAAPAPGRRSVGTVALLAGIAVLVVGAGAFAASQVLGGDEAPQPPNRTSQPATASPSATAAQRGGKPAADTVVAVLNGTTFNGLAGTIADQLGTAGYRRGATITNPDQTLQTSTVFFTDGARANARRIARRLNIADVRAVDEATRALAPDADVIVLAGADQAP